MSAIDKILSEALALTSTEKLELVDRILGSFYPVSKGVEVLWNDEAEKRIEIYENGILPTVDEQATFSKYKR